MKLSLNLNHTNGLIPFGVEYTGDNVYLPKGTIKKLIGRKLTWKDVPVELKDD